MALPALAIEAGMADPMDPALAAIGPDQAADQVEHSLTLRVEGLREGPLHGVQVLARRCERDLGSVMAA